MSLQLSVPKTEGPRGPEREPDPTELRAALKALPADDPIEAARVLHQRLHAANRQRLRVTLRQEIAEIVRVHAEGVLPGIEAILTGSSVPLSAAARDAALVGDDLVAELAGSYKLLIVEQARRLFGLASSGRALLPVVRAMQYLARRLTLGYRAYASNPKAVWSELHELHHFAGRRALAGRSLPGETAKPLSIYRTALLVAFAEPLQLAQGDVDRVLRYLEQYADLARLSPPAQSRTGAGTFLVKPQRDVPGYALGKRHAPNPHPQDLVLDTQPLAEKLLAQLARLAAGEPFEEAVLPAPGDEQAFRDLVGRLAKHWGSVPSRRFTRLRTHARVEVSIGVRGIHDYLEHASGAAAAGEWLVTNESPRGFALLHVGGPVQPIRVGEVVGLRPQGAEACHVCVVRWVLSDNPEHVELGLEEIAPSARPGSVRGARGDRSEQPVLLLPEVPSLSQAPALIAPLAALEITSELNLGELQSRLRIKATRLIERTVSAKVVQFSAVA
jgi:hypothetical protein